jgi:PIN domain nuclease of toxin-antitoxin system
MARTRKPRLIRLDTHVVCWLYAGRVDLLSAGARAALEVGRLAVSPMVDLELQFLNETGRISKGSREILETLADEIGLSLSEEPLQQVIARARELHWTRDPFDRLIVADALAGGAHLVTRDTLIREQCRVAVW